MLVFARDVVVLFGGPEFGGSSAPVTIIGFAAIASAVSRVFRFSALALRQGHRVLLADLAGTVVALVSYFVLIPRHSYVGAAVGRVLAETAVLAGTAWVARRATGVWPRQVSSIRIASACVLAYGACRFLVWTGLHWQRALDIGHALAAFSMQRGHELLLALEWDLSQTGMGTARSTKA